MASKRELKKDIRYITDQILMNALELASMLEKEDEKKQILDIMVEVANTHNDLLARINHPDGKDSRSLVKAHYKKIIDDLLSKSNLAYEKLSKLVSEQN